MLQDPYLLGAWLRVALAAIILAVLVGLIIVAPIAMVLAAKRRQRAVRDFEARRLLTPEERQAVLAALDRARQPAP